MGPPLPAKRQAVRPAVSGVAGLPFASCVWTGAVGTERRAWYCAPTWLTGWSNHHRSHNPVGRDARATDQSRDRAGTADDEPVLRLRIRGRSIRPHSNLLVVMPAPRSQPRTTCQYLLRPRTCVW